MALYAGIDLHSNNNVIVNVGTGTQLVSANLSATSGQPLDGARTKASRSYVRPAESALPAAIIVTPSGSPLARGRGDRRAEPDLHVGNGGRGDRLPDGGGTLVVNRTGP